MRLGARHPLARVVPNIGFVTPQNYLSICHAFLDHGAQVDALLAPDLLLGTFSRANLQTAHDTIQTKIVAVDAAEMNSRLKIEEREQLFGDETEEVRLTTSIIARLLNYHAFVNAMFPNQPIADSLPRIFQDGGGPAVPTFRFNWVLQPGGIVKTWYEPPTPALPDATQVYLREGVVELLAAVIVVPIGSLPVHNFNGVTVIDDLDRYELRTDGSQTVAVGVRDLTLPEPA